MVYRNKEDMLTPQPGQQSNEDRNQKAKKKGIQPGSDKPCKRIKADDRYCRV